jgi:4,5-DOPA dioxygenase extradiol
MNSLQNILFLPHGAPTFALETGAAGAAIAEIAKSFPTPRAVIVVSPHWESPQLRVGSGVRLETIHDFYGFDERLYQIEYPATGCPELAHEISAHLQSLGVACQMDTARGLDHGAWIPLRMMYPSANVPIVPVSLQSQLGTVGAFALGQMLSKWVDEDVLLVASGNLTHNLGDYRVAASQTGMTPEYVQQFADWVNEKMKNADVQALINYRAKAPSGVRAHPSEEHLLPLFVALGAAIKYGDDQTLRARAFYRGVADYVLAMDAYLFERDA